MNNIFRNCASSFSKGHLSIYSQEEKKFHDDENWKVIKKLLKNSSKICYTEINLSTKQIV